MSQVSPIHIVVTPAVAPAMAIAATALYVIIKLGFFPLLDLTGLALLLTPAVPVVATLTGRPLMAYWTGATIPFLAYLYKDYHGLMQPVGSTSALLLLLGATAFAALSGTGYGLAAASVPAVAAVAAIAAVSMQRAAATETVAKVVLARAAAKAAAKK